MCPCVSQQEELHALHLVYNQRTPTDVPESSTEVFTLSGGTAFSAGAVGAHQCCRCFLLTL